MYGCLQHSHKRSCLLAGICAALYYTVHEIEASWWRHPYPYQSFAVILGFIIIFRHAPAPFQGAESIAVNCRPIRI